MDVLEQRTHSEIEHVEAVIQNYSVPQHNQQREVDTSTPVVTEGTAAEETQIVADEGAASAAATAEITIASAPSTIIRVPRFPNAVVTNYEVSKYLRYL